MQIAGDIVSGPTHPNKEEQHLSAKEYVDRRVAEMHTLARSPDHQILAVFMEQEIAQEVKYRLGRRESISALLYALRTCDPLHGPIAKSLTQAKIDTLRDLAPGSEAFDKWDENQAHYAKQMLKSPWPKFRLFKDGVKLNTGFENIEYSITQYSFSIAQYFYALHVARECFPDNVATLVRHATGVQQVKNSAVAKSISKIIKENIESGEYPEHIDVAEMLQANLKGMASWMKPRDAKLAEAYVKGKRDVQWLEQFAPASVILEKMIERLADTGFHHKRSSSFAVLVLDLCEAVRETDRTLAIRALYDLATALSADKVLGAEGATAALERAVQMSKTLPSDSRESIRGALAIKLMANKLGSEESEAVGKFIADNDLTKTAEQLMEKLYPNVIERAKLMQTFGMKSDSKALLREKGRALMDDLGF